MAQHSQSITNQRAKPFYSREQLRLLGTMSLGESLSGDCQTGLENIDGSLQVVLGGGATTSAFRLRVCKINDFRHLSRLFRIAAGRAKPIHAGSRTKGK